MVLTKRFWILAAAGIPLAAVCGLLGSVLPAIAYDILILLAAWGTTFLAPSAKGLRLSRSFDPVLSVRAWNKVRLLLYNDGPEQMVLSLRDEPPERFSVERQEFNVTLPPGESRTVEYEVRPVERGSDAFRGTFVRVHCPFGLAVRQEFLTTEEPVRIYPNILALREFNLLRQQGRLRDIGIRRTRTRGLGTEFESIRQYSEGDDYRKIDWKATARKGDLMVRQYEQERNQPVIICIDVGRHMLSEVYGVKKLDHVLDSLLMLANAAAIAGDQVGLIVFSDTVKRYLPPKKGHSQISLIIEASHDLVAEPVESDLPGALAYLAQRWNRRSLLVIFSDCVDPDRAQNLLRGLAPAARRHLTLFCRINDGRINEIEARKTETVKDMYQKAAAAFVMEDRRAAQSLFTNAKVNVLDSEPQELAAKLVNYYFMVKEKNKI